jgi:epoxyqueuosine reductase
MQAGMHGEMGYMERTAALRQDPRAVLEGCTSLVAVAMSYHSSHPTTDEAVDPDRVWVSRYAWGRDYHKVLKKKLVRLGRWLGTERPGCSWRAYVDTAPILEREWAATAGLGWIGRNTQLLNRRLGSELFLGVVLTDVSLVPDRPGRTHCGRCRACLDACPTGALSEDGVLDARRCLAYLTIEHRGEIPEDLQPAMGAMVAGCDICQDVCPWNRRAATDLHPEFAPAPHRLQPRLMDLESLDEEGFRRWRQGSPLNRVSFGQFRRNLTVARRNRSSSRDAPIAT